MELDDQATLVWLDDAMRHAFERASPELWAYLEAILEEGLFEVEPASRSL